MSCLNKKKLLLLVTMYSTFGTVHLAGVLNRTVACSGPAYVYTYAAGLVRLGCVQVS